jgi:hypothetical protein
MEKTTEMTRARKEVARVPTRKGNAPNSLFTGSHVELNRNRIPKLRMDGKEAMTREKNMARRRSRTNTPAMESIFRNVDSDSAGLRQRIVSVLALSTKISALLWFIFYVPSISTPVLRSLHDYARPVGNRFYKLLSLFYSLL